MSFKYFINYVRTETCYFYFLLMQLILIIALFYFLIRDFGAPRRETAQFVLEVIVTAIVTLEIIVRIATQKKAYFSNLWNIADLIGIIIIIALFIIVEVIETSNPEGFKGGNIILPILLILRYGFQLIRVLLTLKHNREMKRAVDEEINLEDDYKERDPHGERTALKTKLSLVLDDEEKNKYDSLS